MTMLKENLDEELMFVRPSEEYADEIWAYKNEFLENNDSMDGCGPLRRAKDVKEYLEIVDSYLHKETLPEKMVIASEFFCIRKSDNRLVGMIQVRHYFNDYLEKCAGHIGYSVRPSERLKGYATWMLCNIKPFCRSIDLDRILVCCLDDNEGSRKTILNNGGVYDGTAHLEEEDEYLERYWIEL